MDFLSEIILENDRAVLSPLSFSVFDELGKIAFKQLDLLSFSPSQICNESLLTTYIANAEKERSEKTSYAFVIFDKKFERIAGSTRYMNISLKDQRLEIGSTWIGKEFQRTGLNQNCKKLLLEYAFEVLGMERVELKTDERNVSSRAAIEAIGAQYEGTLRSHTVMSDGFRRSTVYYSILKEEWLARK